LRDEKRNHLSKLIFGALHGRAPKKALNDNIVVQVSKRTLAKDLGISEDRIRIGINQLVEVGWINKKRQSKLTPNIYTLYPTSKKSFKEIKAITRVHLKLTYDYALAKRLKRSLYE